MFRRKIMEGAHNAAVYGGNTVLISASETEHADEVVIDLN